jgi:hypothetical protein
VDERVEGVATGIALVSLGLITIVYTIVSGNHLVVCGISALLCIGILLVIVGLGTLLGTTVE